jgi:Flp pilus assembly protein TadD
LTGTHFLQGMALEKKGNKAGAMQAFRQAYPLAPQKPEYNANYEGLLRRE